MFLVPKRRPRNGKLPQSDIGERTKERSAKMSTRMRGGGDSTATAMLICAQHLETKKETTRGDNTWRQRVEAKKAEKRSFQQERTSS